MRIIHLLVIGVLVFAAAYVYRIKMESTARTERVLRLHAEIREQRDAIATLRPYSRLRISRCRHGSRGLTRSFIADPPAPAPNP